MGLGCANRLEVRSGGNGPPGHYPGGNADGSGQDHEGATEGSASSPTVFKEEVIHPVPTRGRGSVLQVVGVSGQQVLTYRLKPFKVVVLALGDPPGEFRHPVWEDGQLEQSIGEINGLGGCQGGWI